MPLRLRKFIGMIVLVSFVILYALTVMAIAGRVLPDNSWAIQLIFMIVGGFLWVIPAGAIIWWMGRPGKQG